MNKKEIVRVDFINMDIQIGLPAKFMANGKWYRTSAVLDYVKANSRVQIVTQNHIYQNF